MNNRNNLDSRNFVYALLSGLRLAFYLAVLALILGAIFFVQCEKPKANLRVPYNPLYKNTESKHIDLYSISDELSVLVISCFKFNIRQQYLINQDWSKDSTMTQGKIETLNEILER